MGSEEDVRRFAEIFVIEMDKAAKAINIKLFSGRLTLLPADEGDVGPVS